MLKDVEDLVERYYNTHHFQTALGIWDSFLGDYFALYEDFAGYWRKRGMRIIP